MFKINSLARLIILWLMVSTTNLELSSIVNFEVVEKNREGIELSPLVDFKEEKTNIKLGGKINL